MFGKAKDPVCGMKVKKSQAAGMSEFRGKKYYFCNQACKDKFEKEPEKYVKVAS